MAELMETQGATLIYISLRSDPLLFKDLSFAVKRPWQCMVLEVMQSKHTCKPAHEEPACNLKSCSVSLFGCIHDHPFEA